MRCSICMIGFGGNESGGRENAVTTICGHIFHASCLTTWFKIHSSSLGWTEATEDEMERLHGPCPLCKRDMWIKNCVTVYLEDSQQTRIQERHLEERLRTTQTRLSNTERKLRNERKAHRECRQQCHLLERVLGAVTSHCSKQLKRRAFRSSPLPVPAGHKMKLRSRATGQPCNGSVTTKPRNNQ